MSKRILTRDEALAAWAVLVEVAGARDRPDDRDDFVRHATRAGQVEYRFQGTLGFGGKFYFDGWTARVGCYPEDRTPLRDAICEVATSRLRDAVGCDERDTRPMPDAEAAFGSLAAAAEAIERVAAAVAHCDEVRRQRVDPDRSKRVGMAEMRKAEHAIRTEAQAAEAAGLRARELVRRFHGGTPGTAPRLQQSRT